MRDLGELLVGNTPRPGEVVIGVWKNQSRKVSPAFFFLLFLLLNPALLSLSFLTFFLCGLLSFTQPLVYDDERSLS
jgi:hypothetical protein